MIQDLNHLQKLGALGQSVWYDNMYRALIATGELDRLLSLGVTGLTSNPTIFQKAISSGEDYDDSLAEYASRGLTAEQLFEALATEDIRRRPTFCARYHETTREPTVRPLEVSPRLAHDTDATVKAALRLFAALDRPNVMIKVPATPEGIPAIRELIGRGVNINVTLIFSLEMYARVREAYIAGLEDLDRAGGNVGAVASVASFFVSRVDTAVDGLIEQRGGLVSLMGKAAVANAKIAYQDFTETFGRERFQSLARKRARVQRALWASTSTRIRYSEPSSFVEALVALTREYNARRHARGIPGPRSSKGHN